MKSGNSVFKARAKATILSVCLDRRYILNCLTIICERNQDLICIHFGISSRCLEYFEKGTCPSRERELLVRVSSSLLCVLRSITPCTMVEGQTTEQYDKNNRYHHSQHNHQLFIVPCCILCRYQRRFDVRFDFQFAVGVLGVLEGQCFEEIRVSQLLRRFLTVYYHDIDDDRTFPSTDNFHAEDVSVVVDVRQ